MLFRVILKNKKKQRLLDLAMGLLGEFIVSEARAYQRGETVKVLVFDIYAKEVKEKAEVVEQFVRAAMNLQKLPAITVLFPAQVETVERSKAEQLCDIFDMFEKTTMDGPSM